MLVFNSFRLDVTNVSLRRDKQTLLLTPKAFNVLRYLVEHAGQLVTKAELLRAVWPGISVTDAALTMCVSEIRKALGDDPKKPRYLETVHRLGYRFIAPVSAEPVKTASSRLREEESAPETNPPCPSPHFVGRAAELEQLNQWLGRALQGERQIVFVTGEAGIGKTTLLEEFLKQAQAAAGESRWVGRGQCVDHYGAGEAYLPVLDALGRLCRTLGGGRVVELLDRYAPTWLAQMPGLLDPAERKEMQGRAAGASHARMLRELADAVEMMTAERPLVLLLEDLHWSDHSTVEWLGFLARRQEPARLLLLGTYRPVELIVREHPLKRLKHELQIHGQCKELPLSLLSRAAVSEYLTLRCASANSPSAGYPEGGVAQEMFDELASNIYRRTDGNPLFMVNMVDYLLVREVAKSFGGASTQPQHALAHDALDMPPSIVQMIEHHVERLNPDEHMLLEAASAVGAEFPSAAVAAALERPINEIEAACARLARQQQFIQPIGSGEWPDGTVAGTFQFQHGLYREVLYGGVPPGRRVELHRRIAEREEQAYREHIADAAVELAYHYRLGADRTKTVNYLELAAERAIELHAYHEAEQHYRGALEGLGTLPESPERLAHELSLLVALGSTMGATHGVSAAETAEVYGRARSLAERLGSTDSIPLLWGISLAAAARGELQTALTIIRQFLAISLSTASSAGQCLAHTQYGAVYHFLGDLIAARVHLLEASKHHCEDELRDLPFTPLIIKLVMIGATEWRLGYSQRALHCAEEMVALANHLGDPMSLCMAYFNAGQLYQLTGQWAPMFQATEESLRMSVASRFPLVLAAGKIYVAYSRAQMGDTSGAAEQIREGLSELAGIKWRVTHRMMLGWLTEVHLLTGDVAEAKKSIEEALEFNVEETLFQPELLRLRGEVRVREGLGGEAIFDRAEQDFRAAIDAARGMSAKSDELRATMSLARLLAQGGRQDEAYTMLAGIYGWFTEGFDTSDLRQAKLLLDQLTR